MTNPRSAGFTLIELMVVIAIISLLAVALLPQVVGSQEAANRAADQANLRYHYQLLFQYKDRYKHSPRGGGSQFVLDPWVRRVCEHTEQNFERYWTPGIEDDHPRVLREQGLDNIWQTVDDISSLDTHYAGRAAEHKRGKLWSGKEPLMSNDNEFGPAFLDQTIHVLMGDGSVKELFFDPDLMDAGYAGDGVEEWFPVGADSPLELLQKLES